MKSSIISRLVLVAVLAMSVGCQSPPETVDLFNGVDLTGWHVDVPAADSISDLPPSFFVRDNLLVSAGEPRGHLITDEIYSDYRLEVEYRFSATPGNAGVLVHASTPRALYGMFPQSIEVQGMHENAGDFWVIVEDIEVPDMEARRGPRKEWGITEGKKRRITNLTDESENPLGEWNSMTIEAVGRAIRVWVNGDLVNDGFGATADRGQIALQAEGAEVEFRRVALTPIAELTPVNAAPIIEVDLTAFVPTETKSLRYSPRGEKLALDSENNATLSLGGTDFRLRLERSEGADYYDRLWVDTNGDGDFADESPVITTPSETRGKIWSSFDAVVDLPVSDPQSGAASTIPYPAAFWYVFDPLEPDVDQVIRYSRRGWLEGSTVVDGVPAVVMITESVMDGRFDTDDNWALVEADSVDRLLAFDRSRPANRHAWLGERAYRLVSIDPSGLRVALQYGDPGITRAEEAEQDDELAVDRRAPRSGRAVEFVDFEIAEARAAAEGRPLFVDFKTVWCGPCYTMDEWVFTADAVVDAAADVISTKVDGDDRRDLASRFEVTAYPTVLLLASDGTELKRHVGYLGVDSTAAFLGYE